MARNKTDRTDQLPVHQNFSVKEIQHRHEEDEIKRLTYARTKNAVDLLGMNKGFFHRSDRWRVFNKEKLRKYIKNPYKHQKDLRDLSRFLYWLSYPYRRIIQYYASMIDLTAMICVPKIDMEKEKFTKAEQKKIRKDYASVLSQFNKMQIATQIYKLLTIAWREDAVFAYAYEDEHAFFLLPLDGNYCKICSQNYDGTFNFAFDMSYFDAHLAALEYWDEEFYEKYQLYLSDRTERWQALDPDKTFCIKINADIHPYCIPPFLPLFEAIIDLLDLQALQSAKDELSVYKMIVMVEKTREKATEPDDFTVDLDTASAYYNRLEELLPESVSAALSPLPIETIEFKGDTTDDVDMVSNSMSNLFKSANVSQILDGDKIEGSVAFTAAMVSDSVIGLSPLGQINAWVNRYINYKLNDKPQSRIKFLEVTPYTKSNYLSQLQQAASLGIPVKLQISSLLGENPYESYAMEYLENDILELHNHYIPLSSSYTQSGTGANGQTATATNPNGAGRPVSTGEGETTSTGRTETTTTSQTTTSNGSSTSSSSSTTTKTSGSTGG